MIRHEDPAAPDLDVEKRLRKYDAADEPFHVDFEVDQGFVSEPVRDAAPEVPCDAGGDGVRDADDCDSSGQPASSSPASSIGYFSPFGPFIARTSLSTDLISRVESHVDSRLAARRLEVPDGPYIGEVPISNEFLTEGGEESLAQVLGQMISRFVTRAEGVDVTGVNFRSVWVTRQVAGSYSPVHFHSSEVSGVLYLRVPEGMSKGPESGGRSFVSGRKAGNITFITGGKQRFSRSLVSFEPVVGDLYIFPGWLLHAVEPFTCEGERRSMSFNVDVVTA